jgi:hypothetical protein
MFFVVLWMDEIIQIYESGYKLFAEERRQASILGYVGIRGFVLGPWVLACAVRLGWPLRRHGLQAVLVMVGRHGRPHAISQ